MSTLMTISDFEALGKDLPYELIAGVLYETQPTLIGHCMIVGQFFGELWSYSDRFLPGEVLVGSGGYVLQTNPDSLLVPDVAFIRQERVPLPSAWDDWCRVPPEVIVEVQSRLIEQSVLRHKVAIYLSGGVQLVLVADTDYETITAHYADGRVLVYHIGDILDGGDILPGFSVPVADIFA